MNTYTLHLPHDAFPHDEDVLEEADLVKDGFSWGAFLFTFLWFFWHRLWLAGLGVLAAVVALNVALALLGMRFLPAFTADLLLVLLIGLEASSLRRWTLERQGRPAVDAVVAADRDEAEMKSFRRWVARGAGPAPSTPPPAAPRRGSDAVIGLFPEAERSR